MLYW